MSTEQILKLQPDRTLYLRGFTGVGAAAALFGASPNGFSVCGVFRDMADFCVLNIYDADNTFEHYTVRYLPDFDLSGIVLTFDVAYQGLQPLDSAKYSWIDWSQLDVIRADGTTTQIPLWDHAQLVGGQPGVANATCRFTTPAQGCQAQDQLTLFVNNVSFDFIAKGGETAAQVATYFANAINTYDWSTFASHSISVCASADGTGALTLKNARAGRVTTAGNKVIWSSGQKFPGLPSNTTVYIAGAPYTVASVDSPASLTLTQTPATTSQTPVSYLAEYGGIDGNAVVAYFVVRPGNAALAVDKSVLSLAGGTSDNVAWRVTIDFTSLGIDHLRQAWMTFAPQLTNASTYSDTEWHATFTNWTVSDPKGTRPFKCAGPASTRVGNDDNHLCLYSGAGWSTLAANNYWHGFARTSSASGDSVSVQYANASVHDLYLGTSLFSNRGIVSITLDGVRLQDLDCSLSTASELVTRRLLAKGVPAGQHTVTITLLGNKPFIFDFLEAAVPGDFADASVIYPNASPALDFDTDATYKVSPQRLLWHIRKLGFHGQLNEYLGVFWWNQRKRASGYNGINVAWNSAVLTFSGTWNRGETLGVQIGGFIMSKSIGSWDTAGTIATHFASYINAASVSMWAAATSAGQLTIYTRTPNWGDTLNAGLMQNNTLVPDPRVKITGNLNIDPTTGTFIGVDGTWIIDSSASNPVNIAVRNWHTDLFALVKAAGLQITTAFSMELVNPPDDNAPGNEWEARYSNGQPVKTDTGFSKLLSSQCAPIPNVTAYQQAAFSTMAGLQQSAGLTPWLQFGEFLWWYFSSVSQSVGYCSYTDPISIGLASPHGMNTGDRVVISGVSGCAAANGTWTITVTDPTHFTIPASADGSWIIGTGQVRGGSMAYYDRVTAASAQKALGRPLFQFTCQDDDPSVNAGADAAFLASQLRTHTESIRKAVLSSYPAAQFEILYPNDVNNPACYLGPAIPYAQGGRLNAAVNLPAEWTSKDTSGFTRLKIEALSWSAQYSNFSLAEQAIQFGCTAPMNWNPSDTAYLVPWFNGICPWTAEFSTAQSLVPLVNFWAYDHLALMSWSLPLPSSLRSSSFEG